MGDLIVVGWLDADSAIALVQTFDAQGNRLGINNQLSNQVVEYELAGTRERPFGHCLVKQLFRGFGPWQLDAQHGGAVRPHAHR